MREASRMTPEASTNKTTGEGSRLKCGLVSYWPLAREEDRVIVHKLRKREGGGKGRRWRRKHVYSSSSSASTRDRFGGDGELLRSRGSAREPEPARTSFAVGGAAPK